MKKTNLEQFAISDVGNALNEFTQRTTATTIPIVLTPSPRTLCSCYMAIPTGPLCVTTEWGRDKGYNLDDPEKDILADPGFQCAPACVRVAYCVTGQAVTYNAPVKRCPTADNVMVDCDLTLVFNIGPAARQVKMFIYKIGARRFDEMLEASVQEAIRHLIRTCPHTDIYELRGSGSGKVKKTLDELNKKFQTFGVNFTSAAITEVRFNLELQKSLQNTTEYSSKMKEEEKKQKNLMDKIKFKQIRELTELERKHAQEIQDLQATRTRVEINRTEHKTKATGVKEVKITQARQKAKVLETEATSETKVAKSTGEAEQKILVGKAEALDAATRIKIEASCTAQVTRATKSLAATENVVAALKVEADMEEKAAPMLKVKREHDLQMAKLEVLANIAGKNKVVISGTQGDAILKEMVSQGILGKIRIN